jgi:hypothetical protein
VTPTPRSARSCEPNTTKEVGIGWHRDKPHFDRVFGLSLEPHESLGFGELVGKNGTLHARSAATVALHDVGLRQVWEHSIPTVEAPGYSITFRTMVGRKA